MKPRRYAALLIVLALGSSACLKTRAQLKDDSDDRETSRAVPAQPLQDVHPQGQYVIDELKTEITQLNGRVEDLERGQKDLVNQAGNGHKEEMKRLEARLTQLEQAQIEAAEALKKMHESSAMASPDELLKKAQAQYAAENYEGAAELFGSYLKTPKPKSVQEATFLRGESYYKLKQYKKAIVEYSKFPERFTHSSRMPEALYKIGLSFDGLGMKEDAKGFYQELVEKFPKSAEAKKVKKKFK